MNTSNDLSLPYRNPHDLVYYFRRRKGLPTALAEAGFNEIKTKIKTIGKGRFVLRRSEVLPTIPFPQDIAVTDIPDATPQIIYDRCGNDEQALLARVRYCRLIDCFTGLSAWHLQGHYRTTVGKGVQVEIDEFYLGCNLDGAWFSLPVEAKTRREKGGIARDPIAGMSQFSMEAHPDLRCRPLLAKELDDRTILLIELTPATEPAEIAIANVRRYRLQRTAL
ncbi:MAG: hypothetical protein GKR94_18535 [Gammaproteobacteria bacterium]|nr:hypothetical protein [Gammaproteobacteria bacterium]